MKTRDGHARVMLGPLGPLVRVGMCSTLSAHGDVEIVGDEQDAEAAVLEARRLLPDAIILSGDPEASRGLCERLQAVAPRTRLIFCTTNEQIAVLDPGAAVARRAHGEATDGLRIELSRNPTNAQE